MTDHTTEPAVVESRSAALRTFLADDLTGAMDTGMLAVNLSSDRVLCLWRSDRIDRMPADAILILDTESRNRNEPQAAEAIRNAVLQLRAVGRKVDYKKIDSTMRGPVAAELEALLQTGGYPGALVCPALPAQGRVIRDGVLYVDGVPLADTDIGHDPLAPLGTSSLPVLLSRLTVSAVPVAEADSLSERIVRGTRVFVGDAETSEDLRIWAGATSALGLLPVGSAGLAAVWPGPNPSGVPAPAAEPELPSPVVFVCGSPASRTMLQVERLLSAEPGLAHVHPDRSALLASDGDPGRQAVLRQAGVVIRDSLSAGKNLLLNAVHVPKGDILSAEGSPDTARQNADRILASLAEFAHALDHAGTLVLLGGDTARVLLDASGADALEILGTALPQIPVARIVGGRWDGKTVVTKAGGFGDPDALVRLFSMRSERH